MRRDLSCVRRDLLCGRHDPSCVRRDLLGVKADLWCVNLNLFGEKLDLFCANLNLFVLKTQLPSQKECRDCKEPRKTTRYVQPRPGAWVVSNILCKRWG